jgi:glutamate racemase
MRPIALIDSGLGGLRVAMAVREINPGMPIVYFADTARAPYGGRSAVTLKRWVEQAALLLRPFNPCQTVLACNTAAGAALADLRAQQPDVHFCGPIEPTAKAAIVAAGAKPYPTIGIIATEATVRSRAYEKAILRRRNHARLVLRPCPLLVPMLQEGRSCNDPLVQLALEQYLTPLKQRGIDVLVLGCTHYGLLAPAIRQFMGSGVALIDSAWACAEDVARRAGGVSDGTSATWMKSVVTDDPARFVELGQRMLGVKLEEPTLITPDQLETAATTPLQYRRAG